jgi:hypothetical protein
MVRFYSIWKVFFAILLAHLGACGSKELPPPQTFQAKGKVVFKDGPPLSGGMVELRGKNDPALASQGHIQPDGTFSLTTLHGVKTTNLIGALPGEYKVTVIPPMGKDQNVQPITMANTVTIQAKDDNWIPITLPISSKNK